MRRRPLLLALVPIVIALGAALIIAVSVLRDDPPVVVRVEGGDPERGRRLVEAYGCTSCHRIPGIGEPEARVGPPLDEFGDRRYVAGDEPNTPEVLIRWLMDPQAIEPGTLMPDLGVSEPEARDIAAFLYSDP